MTDSPPKNVIALETRAQAGHRLSSPSAGRNKQVIAETLAAHIRQNAKVLEIASGTGEHALAIATERPDLIWTPSEPNADSRASVDAWALEAGGCIKPCLNLDVTRSEWTKGLGSFDSIFCANMIHIAPWEAAVGIFCGAAQLLTAKGRVYLYGPFKEGERTAPSNLQFDADLKRRDPRWGVRDLDAVDELASSHGFERVVRVAMPANNLLLAWERVA